MDEGSYHHGNLRAALLARAETVLAESGVAGLSLRGLARDLGVSHAAPSRHFRDREAVLGALVTGGFTELNQRMQAAADAVGTVQQRLAALGGAYLGYAVEHPALLELMFATKHSDSSSQELRELGERSLEIAAELLAEGQSVAVVRPGDPIRLAQVAFATMHGLAALAAGGLLDNTPLDEAAELATDVLLAGLHPADR